MSQPPKNAANPESARRGWLMVRLHRLVLRLWCATNHHDLELEPSIGVSHAHCKDCGQRQYWHEDKEKWLNVPF